MSCLFSSVGGGGGGGGAAAAARVLFLASLVFAALSAREVEAAVRYYEWSVDYAFVSLDCVEKLAMAINGQVPGPRIDAVEGDTVVVKLTNNLPTEGVVIHWHGMRQVPCLELDHSDHSDHVQQLKGWIDRLTSSSYNSAALLDIFSSDDLLVMPAGLFSSHSPATVPISCKFVIASSWGSRAAAILVPKSPSKTMVMTTLLQSMARAMPRVILIIA